MLHRNESDFIYERENNFNFYIKLYKNISLLTIVRIRNLSILCLLIYFMNIQASNISNRRKKANIKNVSIKIKDENGIEKQGKGIIDDLDYQAELNDGKNIEFTINNLEYSGVRVSSIDPDDNYILSNLELNGQGELKGKDKDNNDIPAIGIMIRDIFCYVNITICNKVINTFIRITPEDCPAYTNIDNDTYEMKPSDFRIYLHDNSNGAYSGEHYNYMIRLHFLKFFDHCKLFILNNKINSIKISNFKNAGYIYYINIKSKKLERIRVKPGIPSSRKGKEVKTKPGIISDREGKEVTANPKVSSDRDVKKIENKLRRFFGWKRKKDEVRSLFCRRKRNKSNIKKRH